MTTDSLSQLMAALRCLPGVGPKSAQRMAYHLLSSQRQRGLHLASCLNEAMQKIKHCSRCNNFTDEKFCGICLDERRDRGILCVVESPADVIAIEQSSAFNGCYYVLMNKISPIDGIGPEDIGLDRLELLVDSEKTHEVILALSPSIEGQTTIHFIHEQLRNYSARISQLAHGIPSGGELEYLDSYTIGNALKYRSNLIAPID